MITDKRVFYPKILMIFTKSTKYALRALIFIAGRCEENENCSIRDVAGTLDIPFHFLTKILQKLTEAGLLVSTKGTNGGVRLSRSPDAIILNEIILAIDSEYSTHECVLGFPTCDDKNPCALHSIWQEPKESLERIVMKTTLSALLKNKELIKL